ncbi:MAG: ankyrin repeat domain-containing protein, partial [bacterium]
MKMLRLILLFAACLLAITTFAAPIYDAIEKGDVATVRQLLQGAPGDLDLSLIMAVKQKNLEIVQLLLEKGANPSAIGDHDKTVLHYAAES